MVQPALLAFDQGKQSDHFDSLSAHLSTSISIAPEI